MSKTNNFVFKGTAPSSSGVNKLLGFANPFSVIGKIAGWAAGIDPEVDDKKVVDGQQIYTKTGEGGMSYSYNFLNQPYEVDVVDGKVVDKLSQDVNGKYPGDEGYDNSTTRYAKMAEDLRKQGKDDEADAVMQEAEDNANPGDGSDAASTGAETIVKMAQEAGMAASNEQIQAIIDDPAGWLKANGATLVDKVPNLDPATAGTLLNPNSPNYLLGESPKVDISTVGDISTVDSVSNPGAETYDVST